MLRRMISRRLHIDAYCWRNAGFIDVPLASAAARIAAGLARERELLAERRRAALEREEAHCDLPAMVDVADHEFSGGARLGEEDLVEFGGPRDLDDGPDLYARRAERDEEKRDASVLGSRRVRAREDEAPVAHLGERGPDLLARDPHSFPSSTALVARLARSEPASGSEYPWHHNSWPSRIAGRKRRCCSSVPKWIKVGPISPSPMWPSLPGPPARAYSSK